MRQIAAFLLLALAVSTAHGQTALFSGAPFAPVLDAAGWTIFTPTTGTGACLNSSSNYTGTCIVYVDSVNGSNATCKALAPPVVDNPANADRCQTVAGAMTKVRTFSPDWVLLKKGDTVTATITTTNLGYSPSQPLLFGSYPSTPGDRPIWNTNNGIGINLGANDGATVHYAESIAVVGIDFYNSIGDPSSPDFNAAVANSGSNAAVLSIRPLAFLQVENCRIRFTGNAISLAQTAAIPAGAISNVFVRRNVIVDVWGGNGSIIDGALGLLVEENVYDHNGWNALLSTPVTPVFTDGNPNVAWPSSGSPPNGPPRVGAPVIFTVTGGSLPTGFSTGTNYFVISISSNTAQLSATPAGSAITPVGAGSGTIKVGWATGTNVIAPNDNVFTHNLYGDTDSSGDLTGTQSTPIVYRNNIAANDSSGNQIRMGGTVYNNLFVLNKYAFNVGARPSAVTYNVLLNSTDQNYPPAAYGWGIEVAPNVCGSPKAGCVPAASPPGLNPSLIDHNILAHSVTTGSNGLGIHLFGNSSNFAYFFPATNGVTITNNVVCEWQGPITDDASGAIFSFGSIAANSGYTNGTYTAKALTGGSGTGASATIVVSGGVVTSVSIPITGAAGSQGKGYAVSDVLSASGLGAGTGFTVPVASVAVNPTSNNVTKVANCNGLGYSAPNRTLGDYYASIGNPGGFPSTTAGFLSAARLQSKDNWDPRLLPSAANAYIRAGFDMANP